MNWDRFDVKSIENVEVRRKTNKTTENYKTDQLQWIASTWGQNDQKTQNYKRNQITSNLHRFDFKTIKPTQNYKSDIISMNLDRFDIKTIKTTQT